MHIAITGNIGVGKTTLAKMLGDYYKWDVLFELVEENPYLADFYKDMERWSFNLQIYFLNTRFAQLQKIRSTTYSTIIQDRTIYEDAAIFARNLYESGSMSGRDFESYQLLFNTMMQTVVPPDLMIYLKADLPKLVSQINKRGRAFESDISKDYLLSLNRHYEHFVATYDHGRLIEIDVNALDFEQQPEDFRVITGIIDKELLYV